MLVCSWSLCLLRFLSAFAARKRNLSGLGAGRTTPFAPPDTPAVAASGRARMTEKKPLMKNAARCYYCGRILTKRNASIDHKIPKCRGGTDFVANLVDCCKRCNLSKGPLTAKEYLDIIDAGERTTRAMKAHLRRFKCKETREVWRVRRGKTVVSKETRQASPASDYDSPGKVYCNACREIVCVLLPRHVKALRRRITPVRGGHSWKA